MMGKVFTFNESAMRQIVQEMRILNRRTERAEKLANKVAKQSSGPRIEFAQPQTSLQVGSTCTALLCPWNGTTYSPDSRLEIQISDLHAWAFAVGVSSWGSSPIKIPVIESPKRGFFEVPHPFGLIQKGKPDSNIASGASGTVSIYSGSSTDTTVNITGYVDWAEGGTQVASGKETWWEYSLLDQRWNWAGGECE
jgi:hypothetical protein